MSKIVEHVARLIHERDRLNEERQDIDERICAIDAEIERAWHSNMSSSGMVSSSASPAPAVNAQASFTGAAEDVEEDEDEDAVAVVVDDNKLEKLVGMIRISPVLDYGNAAQVLHGADTSKMRKRIRSSLHYLQTKGRIKNLGKNQWEVLGY